MSDKTNKQKTADALVKADTKSVSHEQSEYEIQHYIDREFSVIDYRSTTLADLQKADLDFCKTNQVVLKMHQQFFDERGEQMLRISRMHYRGGVKPDTDEKYAVLIIHFDVYNGHSFRQYGSNDLDAFLKRYQDNLLPVSSQSDEIALLAEADKIIAGEKSMTEYQDNENYDDSALMTTGSSEHLHALSESLVARKKHLHQLRLAVSYRLAEQKRHLDNIRSELMSIVSDMNKKVQKIREVIDTIELYLGINEQIIQIQEGPDAPVDTPITFHQEVLCMDEEVGDPTDEGLDFNNIDDFDQWLTEYSEYYKKPNYQLVLPEELGVVIFKVRRHDKYYNDNPFVNRLINIPNDRTYVLIRQGKNLYRIWADLQIWPVLFPKRSKLQELYDAWNTLDQEMQEAEAYNEKHKAEGSYTNTDRIKSKQDEINEELFIYKKQLLMMQGLIDRTEVFGQAAVGVKLTNDEAAKSGKVNFVYDAEAALSDGQESYKDWLARHNQNISVGSRVCVVSQLMRDSHHDIVDRYSKIYQQGQYFQGKHYYNLPELPQNGIYQVEHYSTTEERELTGVANSFEEIPEANIKTMTPQLREKLKNSTDHYPFTYSLRSSRGYVQRETYQEHHTCIKYLPEEDPWDRISDRKNRISFKLYPDDDFLICLDKVKLAELDFYLYDRRHRKDYFKAITTLLKLQEVLIAELHEEQGLIQMLKAELRQNGWNAEHDTDEFLEATIREKIDWWKDRNKYKRALSKDETKALRMIRRKLWLPTK